MNRRSFVAAAAGLVLAGAATPPVSVFAQEADDTPVPATLAPLPGGKLVFQQSSGGDLYLMNADGSDLHVIGQGLEPALSPDGRRVIYAQWTDPAGLYVCDLAEATSHRLYAVVGARWPSWSPPDGRLIAFYEPTDSARLVQRLVDRDGFHGIGFVNDLSWNISLLAGGEIASQAVPLPTSRALIGFNVTTDHGTGRTSSRPIMGDAAQNVFSPAWSPDGKEIVFKAEWGLYRVNLRNQAPELSHIENTDFRFRAPQWSPDGSRILFLYWQHDHNEICWISADGKSGLQPLTQPDFYSFGRAPNNVAPAYSPDGTKIAFLSNPDREDVYNIFVMNADGSSKQKLLDVPIQYENQFERAINWGS